MNPYAPPEATVHDLPPKPGSWFKAIALGLATDIGGTLVATGILALIYGIALDASRFSASARWLSARGSARRRTAAAGRSARRREPACTWGRLTVVPMHSNYLLALVTCLFAATACAQRPQLTHEQTVGPDPVLPSPSSTPIPTIHVASAKGWPTDTKPASPEGRTVSAFATGLEHPRWVYVLPNGDVLVAETNAPERPDEGKGVKGHVMKLAQTKAGAAVPSPNRIILRRDADGDGVPETRSTFLEGLNSPFGMALVGDTLYVANTDAVVRFPYKEGEQKITAAGTKLVDRKSTR